MEILNNSQIDGQKIVYLDVVNSFELDFIISTKNHEK